MRVSSIAIVVPLALLVLTGACATLGGGKKYRPEGTRARRLAVVPDQHRPPAEARPIYEAAVRGGTRAGLALSTDAILERVAAELLPTIGDDNQTPPLPVVDFAIRWHGLLDPPPMVLLSAGPDIEAVAKAVEGLVAESATLPYNRVGLAVQPIPGGTRCLVLISMRYLDAEPADLALPQGGTFRLAARVLPPFSRPRVVVTAPDESVSDLPLADAREFVAQVPLPAAGRYDVEVLGEGERGIMVLANFPVFAGVEPPTSVEVTPTPPSGTDPAELEEELFRLVNEARTRRNLTPLARLPDIDRVGRAHSADMVKNRFVGHRSPTTGEPSERLRKAGIVSGLVLENIGRDYSGASLHDGLMRSPGHRANILSPDATHFGVGVVAEPEGNRTAFVATQVFVRFAAEIDPARARDDLVRTLNERRARLGARPVEVDEALSSIATSGAERFFSERLSQEEAMRSMESQLERFGLAYRRVGVVMTVVSAVEEAATIERLLEREMTVVGVGVAQGEHPEHGNRAIAVALVLAWPR